MTLGSPTGSPLPAANNFMPSFLMGESTIPTTPRNNTLSPTKGRSLAFAQSSRGTQSSPPPPATSCDFNRSLLHKPFGYHGTPPVCGTGIGHAAASAVNQNASISGPPTQGLFDSLQNERNYVDNQQPQGNTPINQSRSHQHPLRSLTSAAQPNMNLSMHHQYNNQSFNDSYSDFNVSRYVFLRPLLPQLLNNTPCPFPHRITPFSKDYEYSRAAAVAASSPTTDYMSPPPSRHPQASFWITVFGFPQTATAAIVSHFSQCGSIVDKIFAPQNGNWIHLKFASRLECDRALNYHERMIGNSLMIGVTYCKDPMVVDKENQERNSGYEAQFISQIDAELFTPSPSPCLCNSVPVNRVRPLTHATANYKSVHGSTDVLASPSGPKRSSGLVNKAMDMIFGW